MMKRWMKHLLLLMVFVLLICTMALYYLLYTTSGSQKTLNYLISSQQWPVSYQRVDGYLTGELNLHGLQINTQSMNLSVERLTYQLDWSLWQRMIRVNALNVSDVLIEQQPVNAKDSDSMELPALMMPWTIDVRSFVIDTLRWSPNAGTEQLKQVSGQLLWYQDQWQIGSLDIDHSQFLVEADGELKTSGSWPVDLRVRTQWFPGQMGAEEQVSVNSTLTGHIHTFTGRHDMHVRLPEVSGEIAFDTDVQMMPQPRFQIQLPSEARLRVTQGQQPVQILIEDANLTGTPQAYQLNVNSQINHPKLPDSQVQLTGQGNLGGIRIDELMVKAEQQSVQSAGTVDWSSGMQIDGHLQLTDLDPASWGVAQSGRVTGELDILARKMTDGWSVTISGLDLAGVISDLPMQLSGNGQWSAQQAQANELILKVGENQLNLNGRYNPKQVDASMEMAWSDLSLLHPELNGDLTARFTLQGTPARPVLDGLVNATDIQFQQFQLTDLSGQLSGIMRQSVELVLNTNIIDVGGLQASDLQVELSGWTDQHDLTLSFMSAGMLTQLELSGVKPKQSNDVHWQGVVNQHQVTLADGRQVSMEQPMRINWGAVLTLSEACWSGQEAGQLCVRSDHIQDDEPLSGSLTLKSFGVEPLSVLLPERLKVTGRLNGEANYRIEDDAMWLDSLIELNAGVLSFQANDDAWVEEGIKRFVMQASTREQSIQTKIFLLLGDDSFLDVEGGIHDGSGEWMIDSSVSGRLNSPQLISALSREISEARGVIEVKGNITGPVRQPVVNWQLSQPEGYLKLTRMGTRIEQSELTITSPPGLSSAHGIRFLGVSLTDRQPGRLELDGQLTTHPAWHFTGQLSGENFRILNLPELTLDVSPQLQVQANQFQTSASGELSIPYGHVALKSLPAEGVSNSRDLVIIRDTVMEETEQAYPVLLNVAARIEERIELDVIGLSAGLSGLLNLRQGPDQVLTGFGELQLLDGRYQVYGQQLDIETGELTFAGPLDNPRLNVMASRRSNDESVKAGVRLGGTINQLQSELFSEPDMPDVEQLSYIMTGQGMDRSGDLSSDALRKAAVLLGLKQGNPVFREIQQQFGIDVLTVKSNGDRSNSVIEAGKKINDDLYIAYNQGVFSRLGFWVIKYRINEYLNLQSTQGDDQSIELVYTRRSEAPENKQ